MSEFRQESLGCAAGDKYGPWCGKDLEHDDSKNTVAYFGERAASHPRRGHGRHREPQPVGATTGSFVLVGVLSFGDGIVSVGYFVVVSTDGSEGVHPPVFAVDDLFG